MPQAETVTGSNAFIGRDHMRLYGRVAQASRIGVVAIGSGVAWYAWMLAFLMFLSTLIHIAALEWHGRPPDSLLALTAPACWATHHLAIIATLGVLLLWLRTRNWARSMAVVTAALSAIALAAFFLAWTAFLRGALAGGPRPFIPRTMLSITCRLAVCGMMLSSVCSAWFAVARDRLALWIFLGTPLVLLAALLALAPRTFVTEAFWIELPDFYPSLWSFLCILGAVCLGVWLAQLASRRLGGADFAEPAYWLLGVMAHTAFQTQILIATIGFVPPMMRLLDEPLDMRWREGTVSALIGVQVLLGLAVAATLLRRRGRAEANELRQCG